MDKKDVHQAALATTGQNEGQEGGQPEKKISIFLTINVRGRACLIHDGPFPATPVWIKYLVTKRNIQLMFDNGSVKTVEYVMEDKLHKYLLNTNKIFLIRTEEGKPVEGYDTILLKE